MCSATLPKKLESLKTTNPRPQLDDVGAEEGAGDDNVLPIIPTCPNPMSTYTYLAFWALIGGISIATTSIIWWTKREIKRIDKRIDHHDDFCDDTKDTLTNIQIDLSGIKENVASINCNLGDLAASNRDVIKFMLSRK